MTNDLGLNMSFSLNRENAVRSRQPGREAIPQEQAQAQAMQMQEGQEVNRESGLRWNIEDGSVDEGRRDSLDMELAHDTVAIGHTTVVTPQAVRSPQAARSVRQQIQERFTNLYEQTYANCFHHNRLVARVAEFTVGNILEQLGRVGMSPEELSGIRDRVRTQLTEQLHTNMEQVAYDSAMMEIVA
ncbi:MAG: hypothetical protein ABIH69_04910 [bacterium]